MKPCSLCDRARVLDELVRQVRASLARMWRKDFFTVARNGGCEQTLRSELLVRAEKATGCMAFTEGDGRADLILICPHCKQNWARMEFKSNFAAQHFKIPTRRAEAVRQLRQGLPSRHRLYVHLVTELAAAPGSPMAAAQRAGFKTPYKRFLDGHRADETRRKLLAELSVDQALIAGTSMRHASDPSANAVLWAWAFLVPPRGEHLTALLPPP